MRRSVSPPNDAPLPPGTKLAHFELRHEIGSGAMGTVYEAWDTSLDRAVAVKVLRERIAHEPGVVDRFFREARAAARVNHPNLTHIYFVGREGDLAYFAMEFVPGATLERLVADRGPLPVADAVELLVQAARGLAAAHGGGVIHRDVKPSNLIRRDDGTMKVADFGLAKSMDGDVGATGGGSLMGTPTFMSPEQCRGRTVDARTDIYGLGLVAWFVLVGRPPFASKSLGELLNDHINTPLPSACAERPDLPPAVDDVLARLCAKDPDDRPASMEEVARLVETLRPRRAVPAPLFARVTAFCVDVVVASLAASLAGILLAGIAYLLEKLPFAAPDWFHNVVHPLLVSMVLTAAAGVAILLPELWHQTSVGKVLFDLQVARRDGTRPSSLALIGRLCLRLPLLLILPLTAVLPHVAIVVAAAFLVQAIALVLAALFYFLRDGLTLSDAVTHTRVVYRRGAG